MSCSRAEHKIEYLKPSELFLETMRRDYYYNPAFICLSFTEKYVGVAISDYWFSWIHGEFPRDKTLIENLVDVVQGIQVDEYDLIGLLIEDKNSVVENIHDLMHKLCEKGNFESLKYTCWKDEIESETSAFGRAPHGFLFWRKTFYFERCEHLEVSSAEKMLQSFLDCFWALYMDEGEEWEDEDEEWEDEELEIEDRDLEMVDSKRKMIEYLKPLQFFEETIVSNYDNPVLPMILGLSFNDVAAAVGLSLYYSLNYLNAHLYRILRRDETLLDELVEVVQSIEKSSGGKYECVGIIVDGHNSVDIHNLLDDLCQKGNFKSLKYTCWKDDSGSKSIPFHFSVQYMQSFLDFFRPLYIDKDQEIEVKDDKSEDSEGKSFLDLFRPLYIDKDPEIEVKDDKSEDSKERSDAR